MGQNPVNSGNSGNRTRRRLADDPCLREALVHGSILSSLDEGL
jgi:hypothetical protein